MTEQNDQPVANSTASEHESDVDEAGSEIETVATDVVSTCSRLGLLDLPPELRVMIFRHLLVVSPQSLDFRIFPVRAALAPLAIFRTSRLIYEEAFQVFYGENHFVDFLGAMILDLDPFYARFPFPQIAATIQNIHIPVYLGSGGSRGFAMRTFLKIMPELGNPAMLRGTLVVDFSHHCRTTGRYPSLLKWFARALGRFTNFRTVELFFRYSSMHKFIVIKPHPFDPVQHFKLALEPVLGPAEDLNPGQNDGLRFYPVDYLNRSREPHDGDWTDLLGGLRLKWNDGSTNTHDSETPE